jgi:hypothetical protein
VREVGVMNGGNRTTEPPEEELHVGERDGSAVVLPTVNVLTGRGFVTGKSGSGKSNTASVVIEELLDRAFPVLVVDTDGEYFGLKEEYELLHAGADEECDVRVGPEHAEKLATLALEENVPVVLDVSGYLDGDAADELVRETARYLFAKEKKLKKPFLLVVEEVHEYVPEGAGLGETGRMLIKIGKRGRKHGLGIVGISQRPADVKKDFITQANWLVWHRLTWENDTKVVRRIVGSEYGDRVADLDAGEAFVQLDWTDSDVERVRFRRKRTFDAGATPGLDDIERPELKSVSDDLTGDLANITEQQRKKADRIERLETELERKDERITELERELEHARDVSAAAERMAEAVAGEGETEREGTDAQATLPEKEAVVDRLCDRVEALEARLESVDAGDVGQGTPYPGYERPTADGETGVPEGTNGTDGGSSDGVEVSADDRTVEDDPGPDPETLSAAFESDRGIEAYIEDVRDRDRRRIEALEEVDVDTKTGPETAAGRGLDDLLRADAVAVRLQAALRDADCNRDAAAGVLSALAKTGPTTPSGAARSAGCSSDAAAAFLAELRARSLVARDANHRYDLDEERMERLVDDDDGRASLGELRSQWEV